MAMQRMVNGGPQAPHEFRSIREQRVAQFANTSFPRQSSNTSLQHRLHRFRCAVDAHLISLPRVRPGEHDGRPLQKGVLLQNVLAVVLLRQVHLVQAHAAVLQCHFAEWGFLGVRNVLHFVRPCRRHLVRSPCILFRQRSHATPRLL